MIGVLFFILVCFLFTRAEFGAFVLVAVRAPR
jgi:hypothetical protein